MTIPYYVVLLAVQVVKALGLDIQDSELLDMITEFDHDKDGMISQAEFMSLLATDD